MSTEKVRNYLQQFGKDDKVQEFEVSSATVELAAQALGVEPARIAKSISLKDENGCILIVAAGDGKIDNSAFKRHFGLKAKMLVPEETEELTGYRVGGICPFDNPDGAKVYLDESLRRFTTVYPACGTSNSAIELTCEELLECSRALGWVDVCKGWREQPSEG
ncbi:YbaK/EbsC family protein [Clostridium merdae]|uniref:YbaK/EbsC family protein n=1 Tax=Clostridium merdae TaxID=1958780 RepID=UPI000A2710EB|nr:YbaK/EbsC family protein [Clostridium merdae]